MAEGLEGVVAARTVLSDVDGVAGRLVIRGFELGQLAGRTRFAEAAHLLLDGFLDDLPDLDGLERMLGEARVEAFAHVVVPHSMPPGLNPVETVRALLARIPEGDDLRTALRLLAGVSVFTAAVARRRQHQDLVPPDPAADHAADVLRMVRGTTATLEEAAALDTYLVTVCDHGLNASTFAARVTASTLAGLTSAVLTGLSTLKGPLHGGAPGPVIEMLDAIGGASNARRWIESALDRGGQADGLWPSHLPGARSKSGRAQARAERALSRCGPAGIGRGGGAGSPSDPARAQAGPIAPNKRRVLHRAVARSAGLRR
nr:citrate/2-methylcitrate synthase [Novosphingobium sp. NBM11]